MKYVNTVTGAEVITTTEVSGGNWVLVEEVKEEPKKAPRKRGTKK